MIETEIISAIQLSALLEETVSSTNLASSLESIHRKGVESFANEKSVNRYLMALESERLAAIIEGPPMKKDVPRHIELERRFSYERMAFDWEQRTRRYAVTVLFEYVYFTLIISVFWAPLISRRLNKTAHYFWAILPILLVLPYQLGYCVQSTNFMMPTFQGLLYNLLVPACTPLLCINLPFLEFPIWPVLNGLNQPTMITGLVLTKRTFTGSVFIFSFLIWVIGHFLVRKMHKKQPYDPDDHARIHCASSSTIPKERNSS